MSGDAHGRPSAFSVSHTKYWILNIEYLHSLHSQLDSSLQIQPCMHLNSLTKSFLNFVSPEQEGWIQIVDAICSHCRSEIGEKGEWVHWGRYLLLQTTISDVSQYIHNISKIYSQSIHNISTSAKHKWEFSDRHKIKI